MMRKNILGLAAVVTAAAVAATACSAGGQNSAGGGAPISAKDIKYAVARSFSTKYSRGFPYIQTWLADSEEFSKVYPGPYEGGELSNDKVEAPDDKTVIFKFNKPRPDFPFAAAL